MKESKALAVVLGILLSGERMSDFLAEHGWFLFAMIVAVIAFWIFFFRKPPSAPSA